MNGISQTTFKFSEKINCHSNGFSFYFGILQITFCRVTGFSQLIYIQVCDLYEMKFENLFVDLSAYE